MSKRLFLACVSAGLALAGAASAIPTRTAASGRVAASGRTASSAPAEVGAGLTSGLVGYWSLEEASGNRADALGTNNLAVTGAVAQGTGVVGYGCDFVANTNLSVADSGLGLTGSMTVVAWVKATTATNGQGAVGKDGSGSRGWSMGIQGSPNRFRFSCSANGSSITSAPSTAFGAPASGTWYWLCGDNDSANNLISIRVNNRYQTTAAFTGPIFQSTDSFRVGLNNALGNWVGSIDEVGVWNRLLTDAEREYLHNGGSGRRWPFKRVSGLPLSHDSLLTSLWEPGRN